MGSPYNMPPVASPMVDSQGRITQAWAGLLRDYMIGLKSERAPGRVQPFWLSAAELADDTKFCQTGANIGLGVGDYLGWAKCDGNGGRPAGIDGTFPRWSLAGHDAAGASGGADSSAHTHSTPAGTSGSTAIDVTQMPSHRHTLQHNGTDIIYAGAPGGGNFGVPNDTSAAEGLALSYTGGGLGHTHTTPAGTSGAASATDNRPAFKSWVPLMRVS